MPNTIRRCVLTVVVSLLAATPLTAQTQDVKGSKDHPLISRYPGSIIREYVQKEYDEFLLPLGKAVLGKFVKSQRLEGKVTRILHKPPEGRSALEVFRNYEGALKKAGFVTLFTCIKEECVDVTRQIKIYDEYLDLWATNQGIRYLSGKLSRPEGDVYVSLFTM